MNFEEQTYLLLLKMKYLLFVLKKLTLYSKNNKNNLYQKMNNVRVNIKVTNSDAEDFTSFGK